MLFGSISYLNLLPFQLFLKRYLRSDAAKMSFRYKRAVPSQINASLRRGEVNAAFISSIESQRYPCTNLGIIAKGKVYSVFLLEGDNKKDPASATSNQLAKILDLRGKVLIGDAALKYYLDGKYKEYHDTDLAEAWYERTKLPFVFAKLCYNKHGKSIQKLSKRFTKSNIKIPQYILKKEAKKRGITSKQLRWYLNHIHYKIDYKAEKSLKLFLKSSRLANKQISPFIYDFQGNRVTVNSYVKLLSLDPKDFQHLSYDKLQEVISMIGETFQVYEIDDYNQAWVSKEKWLSQEEVVSHNVALSSHEIQLIKD